MIIYDTINVNALYRCMNYEVIAIRGNGSS